jgi:hypothetical protein
MAKFSPTDAVFEGFRFALKRPATLLIWSGYLLAVVAVAVLALFNLGGDQMTALIAASQTNTFDMAQISKLSENILPASSFCLLLFVVFGSVLVTAILRCHLEPSPHTWGGLRFGGDELRVLGANLLVILAVFWGETVVGLAADLSAMAGIPSAVVMLVGFLLIVGLQVRLSLVPVVAMTEKRLSLRGAWTLTGQGFWRLLGAYVLLFAISLVLLVLIVIVFSALMTAIIMAGGGRNPVAMLMAQDFQGLNPATIGVYVLMNLAEVWLSLLVLAASLGINVAAYRAFKEAAPAA